MNREIPKPNIDFVSREELVHQLKRNAEKMKTENMIHVKGKGIQDTETKRMIHDWRIAMSEHMNEIDLLMEQGKMCEEAGLVDEAVIQYKNALEYGQNTNNFEREEEIVARIANLRKHEK